MAPDAILTAEAAALARDPLPPDDDRSPAILAAEIILFVLATWTITARVYVRWKVKPKFWLDDYFMLAAFSWTFFGFVAIVMQANYGLGRHTIYIGETNALEVMKWNQLARLAFIPCVALIKVSICLFVLRILDPRTHGKFRVYIWIIMAASTLSSIVLLVIWSIQCIPLEALWTPSIKGNCLSQAVVVQVAYVQAAFNLVTDLLCALLPIFFFNTAYMRRRTKGALILLASLGILTSVTAVLRVVYLPELEDITDATWNQVDVTICALIETKAGIILGCLPTINCLWPKLTEALPFRARHHQHEAKSWERVDSPEGVHPDALRFGRDAALDAVPLRPLALAPANFSNKEIASPLESPEFREEQSHPADFV